MMLLTQHDAALVLKISVRTLERWRVQGIGPRFVRLSHSIRYRQQDLDAHIASRVVGSTAFLALYLASEMTAKRCCRSLSAICFGDRLRAALAIGCSLWLGLGQSGFRVPRLAALFDRALCGYQVNSRRAAFFICSLFAPRSFTLRRTIGRGRGAKIDSLLGRDTPSQVVMRFPRPNLIAIKKLLRGNKIHLSVTDGAP
jgi:hypothetical protein